jgi:hypothetical protein
LNERSARTRLLLLLLSMRRTLRRVVHKAASVGSALLLLVLSVIVVELLPELSVVVPTSLLGVVAIPTLSLSLRASAVVELIAFSLSIVVVIAFAVLLLRRSVHHPAVQSLWVQNERIASNVLLLLHGQIRCRGCRIGLHIQESLLLVLLHLLRGEHRQHRTGRHGHNWHRKGVTSLLLVLLQEHVLLLLGELLLMLRHGVSSLLHELVGWWGYRVACGKEQVAVSRRRRTNAELDWRLNPFK